MSHFLEFEVEFEVILKLFPEQIQNSGLNPVGIP